MAYQGAVPSLPVLLPAAAPAQAAPVVANALAQAAGAGALPLVALAPALTAAPALAPVLEPIPELAHVPEAQARALEDKLLRVLGIVGGLGSGKHGNCQWCAVSYVSASQAEGRRPT